ncbi:MAG TPA: FecR domain-containing protein [Candidatus Acidoferrales bacterium]|nr:FecR domain-containing protein [Candidatus Acidoferrales bacterium]
MTNEKFDRLLSSIRNEEVNNETVKQAGERVWAKMADGTAADAGARTLRSCEDFQALIPAYIENRLPAGRVMLVEDHIHACVACRHALERERTGAKQTTWRVEKKPRASRGSGWGWAFAASAVAAVAFAAVAFTYGFLPGQSTVRGSVASVDGSLYAISGDNVRLIPVGYKISNQDEVRTAKGSTAVLRLNDGSLVEMGERAGVSVSRGWKGTTIHLGDGQVIVQAAKQHTGHLFVATDDCLVSVKGTIFSVNHGIKGSRVAVIEGIVRMDYGDHSTELRAGDEGTSTQSVSKVPIKNEIAWSRDKAKYLALLGDFAVLQKQLAAIPGPGLRYSSELLPYVPDNTVIYAAIPNLSSTLSQASGIIQDRLQQSPALRDWWRQQQKGGPKLQDLLNQLQTFNSYLGDEIVFAAGKTGTEYTAPVVLARVKQPGLESFLQSENSHLSSGHTQPKLQIVHDPWAIHPAAGQPLLVYLDNDVLVASPDVPELQRAVMRIKQGGGGAFAQTPFYQQIAQAYQQGAEWLFCANMEQIVVQNVHEGEGELPAGIGDVRYLTMEHREVGGKTDNRAALTFASDRQGVASWLAAPASMGSLEFVSADASMATSVVIKNPKSILEELFQVVGKGDANFSDHLAEFEQKTGVNVLNDIAAPLGGEVTMAFDGPLLPTPRWKLIFEVYDPTTLQSTIEKLVDSFNSQNTNGHTIQLSKSEVGSQTYYTIGSSNQPNANIVYSYVDNYLVAAPDVATISRAIQIRQAGYSLTHSRTFQALLPDDGYTNFSAIFYHNVGPVVGPLADQLKSSGALTPQQQQSIDALKANSAPGLIYCYGERDRIVVASNTGFMGFDLGTLLGMGHNGPFLPQMLLGDTIRHPAAQTQPQ